jgi:hypothetical protein
VIFRQGGFLVLIVTGKTIFFSFLFAFDFIKSIMYFIMGKMRGGFFGSVEKKDKNTCTNDYK